MLTMIAIAASVISIRATYNLIKGARSGAPEHVLVYDFDWALGSAGVAATSAVLMLINMALGG